MESVARVVAFFATLLHRKIYKREGGGRGGYMKKLFLSYVFHHRCDVRRTTSIYSNIRRMDAHCHADEFQL